MDWSDDGYILSTRKHGEHALILSVLTQTRGRQSGLVRGGAGRRQRGSLQIGNLVRARWRGRLPEHLGSFTCELMQSPAALHMDSPDGLAALNAACSVLEALLPEGQAHGPIFEGLGALVSVLAEPGMGTAYVRWELGVLSELGFGLDLSSCAVTGQTDGLSHVSPKSGRAVSPEAAEPYRDKLLPLPAFINSGEIADNPGDIIAGLGLTGHFLYGHALSDRNTGIAARERLIERFLRQI